MSKEPGQKASPWDKSKVRSRQSKVGSQKIGNNELIISNDALIFPRQLPYNILTATFYQFKHRLKLGIVVVWVGYNFIA